MRIVTKPDEFQPTQKMKFTKTETEYNMKSIRFLLLTITTMFILIGALMIVLGISVYSHYHSFSTFYEDTKSGRIMTPSIMCVIIGVIMLSVTSFGFVGSLKKSTCMVNIYAFLLTIILILKLVVVVMSFTVDENTLRRFIVIPISQYGEDAEIRDDIDQLQEVYKCCGNYNFMDYQNVTFPTESQTLTYDTEEMMINIPNSCCEHPGEYKCFLVRPRGCQQLLVDVIVQNTSVLGVLGISVMFIQFLGIIFALLLARCIRKLKSERAFLTWQIKEQIIANREEENNRNCVYIDRRESTAA